MPIYRNHKFITVDKNIFQNTLSLDAIGLLCSLMDMDSKIESEELYDLFPKDSRDTVDAALNELIQNGFVEMEEKHE